MKRGYDGGLQFVFGVGNGQAMACLDTGIKPGSGWYGSGSRPLRGRPDRDECQPRPLSWCIWKAFSIRCCCRCRD